MTDINRLSRASSVSGSDIAPIFSQENGDARGATLNQIKDFVLEDSVETGGILAASSIFGLRKTTQATIALTTSYQNIANYDSVLVTPSGRDSFSVSTVLGELIAARDMAHVMMFCNMTGSWPNNRELTLAVLIGTDANPYESSFKYVNVGRGAGNNQSANFSGPGANLNNGGNIIKAGEKIRLVAKFNTSDNLVIDRLVFVVQTLDGQ